MYIRRWKVTIVSCIFNTTINHLSEQSLHEFLNFFFYFFSSVPLDLRSVQAFPSRKLYRCCLWHSLSYRPATTHNP